MGGLGRTGSSARLPSRCSLRASWTPGQLVATSILEEIPVTVFFLIL